MFSSIRLQSLILELESLRFELEETEKNTYLAREEIGLALSLITDNKLKAAMHLRRARALLEKGSKE